MAAPQGMKARPHHYGFAYDALPRTLLTAQVGRAWMSLLSGPAAPLLLRRVWDDLGETLAPEAGKKPSPRGGR